MKALLLVTSLLITSCISTQRGYGSEREFPVEANPLDINVTYASEMAKGSAKATVILGFIQLGQSEFAYPTGPGGPLDGLPLIGGGGANSVENAAVYNVLAATKSDVLGFPLFTKRVTNYFLWKEEEVWVRGYPGTVARGEAKERTYQTRQGK
ncbi:MAG: hypothetical protein VX951_12745 [Planctomycetota bacterium]|nr:hypothetical protein [Planctomycetota bacterium]